MKMGATQELSPKSFLSRYTPHFALLSSCSQDSSMLWLSVVTSLSDKQTPARAVRLQNTSAEQQPSQILFNVRLHPASSPCPPVHNFQF